MVAYTFSGPKFKFKISILWSKIKQLKPPSVELKLSPVFRYGFSFGDNGDDFVGWGGFATKGDMFANSTATQNISYNGAAYAHFIYFFFVLNLVPTIVAGQY